jgi:hypothetical protein
MFSAFRNQSAAQKACRRFATSAKREADFTHAAGLFLTHNAPLADMNPPGHWWRRSWIGDCETVGRQIWDEYTVD